MAPRGPAWTPAEVEKLKALVKARTGWTTIAKKLNRTSQACSSKAATINCGLKTHWSEEDEAELIRLREVEKWSWLTIDSHFHREHGCCSHKYHRLRPGVAAAGRVKPETRPRHPHWTDDHMALAEARWRELFVNVYGERASPQQRYAVFEIIGRELQRSPSAIENRLRLYGASFGLRAASKPLTQPAEVSQAMCDRAFRLAAQLKQDPVARMLGDPPPGYSALDQKSEPSQRQRYERTVAPITLAMGVDL